VSANSKDDTFQLLVADVFELAGTLRRHGDELAGDVGQSQARWQVLSVCSEGDWTVPDAARRLGVSRQAVQRVADLLVADDLAAYEPNPGHRRSPYLQLTASGRAALQSIDDASRTWRTQVVRGVTAAELEQAHQVLRAVLDGIER
jgi:DNA-binding MarR family transcriptional regulator